MGGTFGWLFDPIRGLDKKHAAEAQMDAATAAKNDAVSKQIEYYKQAQAQQQAFEQEQLQKQLESIKQSQQYGVQGAQMGMGADLSQMIAQLQMAGALQQQNMPQLLARQAMFNQSLPNILAMSGGSPIQLPQNLQTINYAEMIKNLPQLLQQGQAMAAPIVQGAMGPNGQPDSGGDMGKIIEMVKNENGQFAIPTQQTALQPGTPVDINALVTNNPEYALRNQVMNENLNRRLSGMGKQNSSDAGYMQGRLSSDLMADAYNKAYEKQLNLYKMATGEAPQLQGPQNLAEKVLAGMGGSMGGSGITKALQDAADARTRLYGSQKDSSQATLTAQMGKIYGAQGADNFDMAMKRAGLTANQPSWLDTALDLYSKSQGMGGNKSGGSSNPFSGWNSGPGNSSSLNWWENLQPSNPLAQTPAR